MGVRGWGALATTDRLRVLTSFLMIVLGVPVYSSQVGSISDFQSQAFKLSPKLIVVVANRLTLSDFDDPTLPNITRLLKVGCVGLVSPNCQKPRREEAVLLTAATGVSSPGGPWLRDFYDANETVPATHEIARDAYATRTGRRAPTGSAVFLGLAQAMKAINESGVPARVGLIGDILSRAGMRTCVVGNADTTPSDPNRATSILAADSYGFIDVGKIGASLGPTNACGLAISVDSVFKATIQSLRDADFVVVNFGDSTRLDEMKISLSDAAYEAHRQAMVRRLDELIGRLIVLCKNDPRANLILVSFSPSQTGYWNRLTPVVVLCHNQQPGLLTSKTTRTPGLVAASDFPRIVLWILGSNSAKSAILCHSNSGVIRLSKHRVPSHSEHLLPSHSEHRFHRHSERSEESQFDTEVLRFAQDDAKRNAQDDAIGSVQDETGFVDRTFKSAEDRLDVLREIDKRVEANHTLILPMLWAFAIIAAISLTVSALFIAFGWPLSRRVGFALRLGILLSASACLSMLLAVLGPPGVIGYSAISLGLTVVIALAVLVMADKLAISVIFAMTVFAIVLDAITGCTLCKFALPSSYQLEGFRYYGIGNEYAAALISMSALVALSTNIAKLRTAFVLAMGLMATLVLGIGALGSNYGAAAASVVTFGLIMTALRKGAFGARHVLGLVFIGVLLGVGFAYLDWLISGSAGTHGAVLISAGVGEALVIASRKMLMNAELASSRTAQHAVMAILPFVALWLWRIQPKLREALRKDDRLNASLKALMVGSISALVMNDSGIVMAGIMVSMTVLALMYDLLWRETNAKDSSA